MAFSDGIDVDVGDAILASHVDNLADNTEFNRENADVDHDFDISTGDGHHEMNASGSSNKPQHVNTGTGTYGTITLGFWEDSTGGLWWLGDTAGAVFDRADADSYIALGNIADVPAS